MTDVGRTGEARAERCRLACRVLGYDPEAASRLEEQLLFKVYVVVVGEVAVVHLGKQACRRDRLRAVVDFDFRCVGVAGTTETQRRKVESVGISVRVNVEVLRQSVGAFGVVVAHVVEYSVRPGHLLGIVFGHVFGRYNGIIRHRRECGYLLARRNHAAGRRRRVRHRRHGHRHGVGREAVLEYALAGVVDAELVLAYAALRRVNVERKGRLAEIYLRAFVRREALYF